MKRFDDMCRAVHKSDKPKLFIVRSGSKQQEVDVKKSSGRDFVCRAFTKELGVSADDYKHIVRGSGILTTKEEPSRIVVTFDQDAFDAQKVGNSSEESDEAEEEKQSPKKPKGKPKGTLKALTTKQARVKDLWDQFLPDELRDFSQLSLDQAEQSEKSMQRRFGPQVLATLQQQLRVFATVYDTPDPENSVMVPTKLHDALADYQLLYTPKCTRHLVRKDADECALSPFTEAFPLHYATTVTTWCAAGYRAKNPPKVVPVTDIPVISLTGHADVADAVEAHQREEVIEQVTECDRFLSLWALKLRPNQNTVILQLKE